MRLFLILLLLFTRSLASKASTYQDSLFDKLNETLAEKDRYDKAKELRIRRLKNNLANTPVTNSLRRYTIAEDIYEEYKVYQFDSAYVYLKQLQILATKLNDRSKEADSKVKLGFILLSSGMFKEAFESVEDVNPANLSAGGKKNYYSMLTRAYFDLAAYDSDNYYAPEYNRLANRYIDSAIQLWEPGSFERKYWDGYRDLKQQRYSRARAKFEKILSSDRLTQHQYAIVASTLSTIYARQGDANRSQSLLIEAAMADIRSSTKETLALFWLAEALYKKGDVEVAYGYITHAMQDAEFYGARQRKFQIGTVLPIIAGAKVSNSEREKNQFLIVLASVLLLAAVIAVFSVLLYKQLQKLKAKERIIEETNAELELINQQLVEGTAIKENYIGYFFNVISEYILKLEKLKHSVEMKLSVKRFEDIQAIINKINIKKERDTLYNTFDHVFLKIFPNFISEFNKLFKPEDQMWPKEHEVLTTDLRIFALIRMGIEDDATIANVLEYSEKTIYVYKMRIKAKALVHGDEFQKRLMAIKAVETQKRASLESPEVIPA
ncbi:DUF6377 domain-containing protein [Pedobacter sp. SYSU D00535]|uniref:DUF6377 domain-containing protein n=1 Tax=Pedobacter sp. SYSU D00535 TaxID=2810308 RepID=UPI001A95F726|nr:DUF6377 domain-containing protein [Pedobacter sp. SYSU D00535]